MITYLYVKTHNVTGLKYLGKTTKQDPHKYSGSGKHWMRHLKVHGYDCTTTILKECTNKHSLETIAKIKATKARNKLLKSATRQ